MDFNCKVSFSLRKIPYVSSFLWEPLFSGNSTENFSEMESEMESEFPLTYGFDIEALIYSALPTLKT